MHLNSKNTKSSIVPDIVEYSPDKHVDFITASVAAKVMKELAGKIIASKDEASTKLPPT
jgi:arginase family enzyme